MFNQIIAAILLLFTFTVEAQTKPIKIVIPFGVGGLVDNANRRLQEALVQELGRPVQLEPKPGAAGYIGLKHMATNKSDEVLISIMDAMAIANVILLYDDVDLEDFKYLTQIGVTTSIALAVRKGSNLKNIDAWRNYTGRPINVGINGIGGAHHYYSWIFENQAQTAITYVPFRGVNEMLANLFGGHIDAGWANLPSLEAHEQAGKIDIVAVAHPTRPETMPHVPTFRELGIITPPNAKWLLISNDTTDLATMRQVEAAVIRLLNNPQFVQTMRTTGIIVEPKLIDQAKASMTASLKQQAKFVEHVKTLRK